MLEVEYVCVYVREVAVRRSVADRVWCCVRIVRGSRVHVREVEYACVRV